MGGLKGEIMVTRCDLWEKKIAGWVEFENPGPFGAACSN